MHYAGLHRIEGECIADPSATYTFYWGKMGRFMEDTYSEPRFLHAKFSFYHLRDEQTGLMMW